MRFAPILCGGLLATSTWAFSFRQRAENVAAHVPGLRDEHRHLPTLAPLELLRSASPPSSLPTGALQALRDLESKPLCHRVAVRHLIRNCQLLESKDDATFFTENGPQIRNAVDSAAISMGICDLERGRFNIPSSCHKFREAYLYQVPVVGPVQPHVTDEEIDECSKELARDGTIWISVETWRPPIMNICDATHIDYDKAQFLAVARMMVDIVGTFAYRVEKELHKHMDDLQFRMQEAVEAANGLEPQLDQLRARMVGLDDHIAAALQRSGDMMNNNIQGAADLQQMIVVMVQAVLEGTSQVAAAQEKSVQLAKQSHDDQLLGAQALAIAVASAASLNNQLETSRLEMKEISNQQHVLSDGLEQLAAQTHGLLSTYADHARALDEATNTTANLLETVVAVNDNIATMENARISSLGGLGIGRWVPYIISPIATLLLGSYGLEPSATRNLGLVALGEVVGFVAAHVQRLAVPYMALFARDMANNSTVISP